MLTIDRVPAKAGIDPLDKMIDRNPDDNVTAAKRSSFSVIQREQLVTKQLYRAAPLADRVLS